MDSVPKGILFGLLGLSANLANGSEICPKFNPDISKSEAKPVVKLHPKAPAAIIRKLPACIVVSFELSGEPNSNGKVLIPTAIKTELSTGKSGISP